MSIKNLESILRKLILRFVSLQYQVKTLTSNKQIFYPIIHHTATDRDYTFFESIERGHQKRNYNKSQMGFHVGYQYLITGDGKVYQARIDTEEGCHTRGYNKKTIGICLTGNFEVENPSDKQLEALEKLLEEKMKLYKFNWWDVKTHRHFAPTLCCGKNLYDWVQEKRKEWNETI